MKKVYISGPLTSVTDKGLKEFYEHIGWLCSELEFDPYVPHLLTDPVTYPYYSPKEIYEIDKQAVLSSELVIAYIGSPSIGVGMEIAYADEHKIPIILVYEKNRSISKFPRGVPAVVAEIAFTTYNDALEQLRKKLPSFL